MYKKIAILILVMYLTLFMILASISVAAESPALYEGWNLVSGINNSPADFSKTSDCDVETIWEWQSETESWHIWSKQFLEEDAIFVPEMFGLVIQWMYPNTGYWVYCN